MKTLEQILSECKGEEDFKPHMMYDPKTGKGVKANTYTDHVKYDKMGYTHEKPELKENYRTLARKGMGTETKKDARVGLELDFYETERGDKVFGKIIKVTGTGYIVQAMERGNNKKYTFKFHDRMKAKKLLQNESLTEAQIVYRVRDIQRPEETKFKNVQRMGVAVSMKKQGKDTIVTVKGTKKTLRDVDSVVRGKSSYGDPSTIKHFDEAVSPAQQAAIAISKKEKGEEPKKESRARRDAMRGMSADPDFQDKDSKDVRATDDDRKAASKNILMQIRKATDLPKGGDLEFPSGKKGKISQADAKKVDRLFNMLKKPQDKAKFQKVISKDLNSIKGLLKRLGR